MAKVERLMRMLSQNCKVPVEQGSHVFTRPSHYRKPALCPLMEDNAKWRVFFLDVYKAFNTVWIDSFF